MAVYKYRAKDKEGNEISGFIESVNKYEAIELLTNKSLFVIELGIDEKTRFKKLIDFSSYLSVGINDLMVFSRQLSLLLRAGLTLSSSLDVIAEQTNKKIFKKTIYSISNNIRKGESLNYSMKNFPSIFPPFYSYLIEVGEATGNLDKIVDRLANHYERIFKLKNDLKAAVTYPLFITGASIIIISLIIIFIIPQFSEIFKKLGNYELPVLTLTLLKFCNWISSHIVYIVFLFLFLIFFAIKARKLKNGKKYIDSLILKIPFFGEIVKKGLIVNFSRSFSTLLTSGLSILDSLKILINTIDCHPLENVLNAVFLSVRNGEKLISKMSEGNFFSPIVVRMISVGEETGNVDEMLNKIAEYFEKEIETSIKTISSIIEPSLIIILGVFVGIIVVALYMPIFKVIQLM